MTPRRGVLDGLRRRKFLKVVSGLLVSQRHIVILGPTGAGKTTFARAFVRYCPDFTVFDYYNEYRDLRAIRVKPAIPFGPWVKNLGAMLRPDTGGVEISVAVYSALNHTNSWDDFLQKLERNVSMRRFWRGSEAVLARLLPLKYAGVLSNDGELPPRAVVDLSRLEEEEKAYCVLLMLTRLLSIDRPFATRKFVLVEESKSAFVGEMVTPAVIPLLNRARKFNIRLVLILQSLPKKHRETLIQQNLVVFYPGEVLARKLWLEGFPRDILSLKKHEALVYVAENDKWVKVRVNPQRPSRAGEWT